MADHGLERPFFRAAQRLTRLEKYVSLLLLFILLTAATAGVTAVLTGPDWTALWGSLLIGLVVGWLLAIFDGPARRSALFVVLLGLFYCLLFSGGLDGKVLAIFSQLTRLIASVPAWVKTGHIDPAPLVSASQELITALSVLVGRVTEWVRDLATGQASFDPVAANIVWGLVVWLVSAWAGWVVEAGQNALLAVLPALALNLTTLSYGRSRSGTIFLILGLTLVLIAIVQYSKRQGEWEAHRVAYPRHKGRQIGNAALAIALGLVSIAALISSISLQQISQLTSRLIQPASQPENNLAKSLGIQQPTAIPNSFTNLQSPGLPRELLIGASPQLLAEKVMTVKVDFLSPLAQGNRPPPLYWRSYTYDIYTGHGWSTSPLQLIEYKAGQLIQPGQLADHLLVQQEVLPVPSQMGTVYAAGEPISLNVASRAAWRTFNDLFGVQAGSAGYTVQSLVPFVNESTLRAAGTDYPAWVAKRYLTLPAELPGRVKQLAIQLTATEPTPYDRARAIEQYLRTTYPYTIDVPYPPANQDLVDYFLFDLRKGYCDYYASAMVVLARAAGIPARLAVGYASGTYNMSLQRFIIAQKDAHSWVEVYFPGIGWQPFEPTASIPSINRSGQPLQQATPIVTPLVTPPGPGPLGVSRISSLYAWITALAVIALAGVAWAIYDEAHLAQLPPLQAAAEVYRRLRHYSRQLKIQGDAGQTPYEYGTLVMGWMSSFDTGRSAVYESINLELQALVQRIVYLGYRPSAAGDAVKGAMLQQWRTLRWKLRWMWIRWLWSSIRQLIRGLGLSTGGKLSSKIGQE